MEYKILSIHAGLGDFFICNGLVREIAAKEPNTIFIIPCHKWNMETGKQLFSDISNVLLFPETENLDKVIKYDSTNFIRITNNNQSLNFDESFYECAGIPFSIRYSKCKIPRNIVREDVLYRKLNPHNHRFILLNNASSVGEFTINIHAREGFLPIKVEKHTNNILDWLTLIENAHEIHSIDNGFLSLVESMGQLKAQLYFHRVKNSQFPILSKRWNLINY